MADGQIAHAETLAAKPPPAEPGDRLAEGTKVGDYVIEKFLGAGAMGEVYAGSHPVIGKRVAVKVLKRELASDKEAAERFVREARAVNVVDHPNVIDVFNFGRLDDGRLYLMMDLVDGKSLRQVLQGGRLPVDTALDILGQIADALDAAHAKGVIHRDLKPDNVMLAGAGDEGSNGKVKVLDFGIAKLVSANAAASGTLTEKGSWLGTPGYMAPEQWSADGAGPASDRYALGVMAFELLSGALPFQAPTLPQMMEQHFRAPVPALSTCKGSGGQPPEHHQTLDPVLARAMAKSPEARFETARQLVDALRTAAKGTAVEAPAGTKRSMALPAAAGVGVLGLAVVGFMVIRGGTTDDDEPKREPARPNAAPQDGFVKVKIETTPGNARVMREGTLVGRTPLTIDARPGTPVKLSISKAGYRGMTAEVTPTKETTVRKDLLVVTGFEGVWTMPDGKLRGFWRSPRGDKVEVYQLQTVNGDRSLWRTCELEDPPAGSESLVVFATTADMGDERSTDASCQVPHRIEYRYDPVAERLEVRAESVDMAKQPDGKCVVVNRDPGKPTLLARAETSEIRRTSPPVGKPTKQVGDVKANIEKQRELDRKNAIPNDAIPNDSFDNKLDVPQKGQFEGKQAPRPAPKKAPPSKEPADDTPSKEVTPDPPPQQINAPQVQQKKVAPPQPQNAPPRGDSQQVQERRKD